MNDHAKLRRIIRFIADSSSPRTMARFHRRTGLLTREYLQEGFDKGRDPYGVPWAPSKKVGSRTMVRSGRLRRSIRYRSSSRQVVVWEQARNSRGVRYGPVLQHGAVIRPKNARRLRFQLNGNTIFAKKVTIPPRRFMLEDHLPLPSELAERLESGIWADIRGEWRTL